MIEAQHRKHGFTLVEVLVALVIFAIALSAAVRGLHIATTSAEETRLRTLATWIAQNRVAEREATTARGFFPAIGNSSGEAEMAGLRFRFEETITDTPNAAFRKMTVRVAAIPTDSPWLVTLNAYLIKENS